jgi:tetratricopeptide (TPR) repeat protein
MNASPEERRHAERLWQARIGALVSGASFGETAGAFDILVQWLREGHQQGFGWQEYYASLCGAWMHCRPTLPRPEAMARRVEPTAGAAPASLSGSLDPVGRAHRSSGGRARPDGRGEQLVGFYVRTGQRRLAIRYLACLAAATDDPDRQARYHLAAGGLLEQESDYPEAAAAYQRVLALKPTDRDVSYFGNNNRAYCLLQFGRYAEAEWLCRQAIQIDPGRHNARKNLGLALAGQQQYLQAAESLIAAARLEPRDPRAVRHLDQLLGAHPEVFEGQPDLAAQIARCRRLGGVG